MKRNNFLKQVYVALNNAINTPEILTHLQKYGYNEKKISEGLKQYTKVERLNQQQYLVDEEVRTASQTLKSARKQLITVFQMHLDTARLAYKREEDYSDTLSLTQARSKTVPDLLAQAKKFYANIPVALMAKYHVPQKELNETKKLIQQVLELEALQLRMQAQAQTLTQTRQAAMAELKGWMRTFFAIAKIALRKHPQQLEALDIAVAS